MLFELVDPTAAILAIDESS